MHTSEALGVLVFFAVVISVYAAEMIVLARYLIAGFSGTWDKSMLLRKWAIPIHVMAAGGILCFVYGILVEPYWVDTEQIEIHTPKITKTNLRVVQISDLHCDLRERAESKVVEIVNSLEPDVIVFTGDAVNRKRATALFQDTLKKMKAKIGKYAIPGNVDWWDSRSRLLFEGTGFQGLYGETVKVEKDGEEFYITGVESRKRDTFRPLLEKVPAGKFSILLYHHPSLAESLDGLNVDLYLAGHTHGGQVRIPFYGALVTLSYFGKKYEMGMYEIGDTKLYINRGIGMEGFGPRVRFLCRPEVTVFDIGPAEQ